MLSLKLLRSIPVWDQRPDILPEADLWYLACPNLKYPAWPALWYSALPDIHYQDISDIWPDITCCITEKGYRSPNLRSPSF